MVFDRYYPIHVATTSNIHPPYEGDGAYLLTICTGTTSTMAINRLSGITSASTYQCPASSSQTVWVKTTATTCYAAAMVTRFCNGVGSGYTAQKLSSAMTSNISVSVTNPSECNTVYPCCDYMIKVCRMHTPGAIKGGKFLNYSGDTDSPLINPRDSNTQTMLTGSSISIRDDSGGAIFFSNWPNGKYAASKNLYFSTASNDVWWAGDIYKSNPNTGTTTYNYNIYFNLVTSNGTQGTLGPCTVAFYTADSYFDAGNGIIYGSPIAGPFLIPYATSSNSGSTTGSVSSASTTTSVTLNVAFAYDCSSYMPAGNMDYFYSSNYGEFSFEEGWNGNNYIVWTQIEYSVYTISDTLSANWS